MATSAHELNISSSTFIPSPIHTNNVHELLVFYSSENPIFPRKCTSAKNNGQQSRVIAVRFTNPDSLLGDFGVLHLAAEVDLFNLIPIHKDSGGFRLGAFGLPLDGSFRNHFAVL
jgi:hypothetical protein